jgi:hypothetical protein
MIQGDPKDFFDRMEREVDKAREIIDGSRKPQVGIYWVYKDRLFDVHAHDYDQAEDTSFKSEYLHINRWERLAETGYLDALPLELRKDYKSIPRGRVVYFSDKDEFVIWHGPGFTQELKDSIMETFRLPPAKTRDEAQGHYKQ